MVPAERLERHRVIAAALEAIGDDELAAWIGASEPLRRDGYASLALPDDGTPLFVKLLSLTELEREPRHWPSTANCFGLPPSYGYRIGSTGFGVRRELETHAIANGWVVAGERAQFPLMHSHRVVPIARQVFHAPRWPQPWGDDPGVAARHVAIEQSSHSVAVFLEPFRCNLLQRLRGRRAGMPGSDDDVLRLEPQLLELAGFIDRRGLRHMDAHFENILSDGDDIYLTDFGLAISNDFELSPSEYAFFERHRCFDVATMLTSLVHAIFTRHVGEYGWPEAMRAFLAESGPQSDEMPDADRDFLIRRGPLWLAMGGFYESLRDDIGTEFPADEIERLLEAGAPC
ncbi:MAG: serine/threonine-protein kinase [Pseudomonadales bacterium]